jgi:tight adherence protein B
VIPAVLAAAVVLAIFLAIYARENTRVRDEEHVVQRLRGIARETPELDSDSLLQDKTHSDIPGLHTILANLNFTPRLERLVSQSGLRMSTGQAVLWMGLVGMVVAAICFFIKPNLLLAAGVCVVSGPILVVFHLRRKRLKRKTAFMQQLPDTLQMVRSSLQAGHGLNQAFEVIAEEGPELIAGEFRQMLEELRLGHSMKATLEGIYHRTGVEDLRFFIVAVLLNREIGGNLSEVIESVATTLRERFKLAAQVRSLTAQGRFSAKILALLPFGVLSLLTLFAGEFVEPLYKTQTGHYFLTGSAVSVLIGYLIMKRIVNIKAIRVE